MLNYDAKHDTLYLGIADNSNSYGAEESDYVNVFRNVETDTVTGFIMFDFMRRFAPQIKDFANAR